MRSDDAAWKSRFDDIVAVARAQAAGRPVRYALIVAATALMFSFGWPWQILLFAPAFLLIEFSYGWHLRHLRTRPTIARGDMILLLVHQGAMLAAFSSLAVISAFCVDPLSDRAAVLLLFAQALGGLAWNVRSRDVLWINYGVLFVASQLACYVMVRDAAIANAAFVHISLTLISLFYIQVALQGQATQAALDTRTLQLAQARRGETMGRLAGGVAHDFNNLLTVMRGNLDLLGEVPEAERALLLKEIGAAADRGGRLVAQLLNRVRPAQPQREAVDLGSFLERFASFARRVLPANVCLDIDAVPGPRPHVDPALLEGALLNLVVNSRDAMMPAGGRILVEVRPDERCGERGTRITLRDDGPGIPEELLSQVTQPYVTTKPPGQGTGLGLAMVETFADGEGGELSIANHPQGGAHITLWLPGRRLAVA